MPDDEPKFPSAPPAFALENVLRAAQESAAQFRATADSAVKAVAEQRRAAAVALPPPRMFGEFHSALQVARMEEVFRQAHEAQERERLALERERAADERARQAQLETAAAVRELAEMSKQQARIQGEVSKRQTRIQWVIAITAALLGAAVGAIAG